MKKTSTLLLITAFMALWLFSPKTAVAQPLCYADFNYSIGTVTPNGAQVSFNDSSWTIGTITNWQWSFGNGTGSTQQNPITFLSPGYHVVCLTITAVYQNQTCTSTACDTILIGNGTGCNANFFATTGAFGTQFSSAGSNNVSWLWDFGDGTTSTQPNPVHVYTANGTYTVCLTVAEANGTTCTSCQTITIGSTSGCQAYYNATIGPGTMDVTFTDLSQGNAQYFYWNFGDGSTSTTQHPVHTYNANGTYVVCLTITDSIAQCSDTYCDSVVVTNGSGCNANFGYQTSPAMGTAFNANTNSGVTSYTWDFGDGSTGTGQFVSHVYAPGTYVACLTVTMNNGTSCSSCQTIVIANTSNCSSNFAIYPDTTTLHSYFAYNLATGVGAISYVWSWGDGTSSTGAYPSHTYASAGTYTICLTITDATGCTSTTCYQFALLRLMSGVPVTINVVAGTTGINEANLLNSLVISPNPASDYVRANFDLTKETKVEYTLRNITGQSILTAPAAQFRAGSHELKLDVSKLSPGLYMLDITAGDKKNTSKVLVQ